MFEHLTPAAVEGFDGVFASTARFRDPFNDVRGVAAIQAVFRHMFEQCRQPRFEVLDIAEHGELAYLRWRFHFTLDSGNHCVEGVSRVRFDAAGRVLEHIDYWDPAALYEGLPLIGRPLRWLRKRLGAPIPRARLQIR